jgi:hypothetical protein
MSASGLFRKPKKVHSAAEIIWSILAAGEGISQPAGGYQRTAGMGLRVDANCNHAGKYRLGVVGTDFIPLEPL